MSAANLSPAQQRVVDHPPGGGHLLVLAGPGSGKTRTIVERIDHLLRHGHCEPESILAMTFTLQAAGVLRDRLAERGHAGVTAGTFHHVCARFLSDHGSSINITLPLRIYDGSRQREAITQVATSIGYCLDARGALAAEDLLRHISRRKLAGLPPGEGPTDDLAPRIADIRNAIDEAYTRLLRERGALDYDDLLSHGIDLLRTDPDAATSIRSRYQFVFVDEFHDLSPDQYALLQEIAPPIGTSHDPDDPAPYRPAQVMIVADPDQSIYSFRNADPSRFLAAYNRAYRPAEFHLVDNYRSTATIVHAAVTLRDGTSGNRGLAPTNPEGHPISCIACQDESHEAAMLVGQIRRALASGNYALDDIAVLYRTHARANAAEAALLAAEIPVRRIQHDRFFDQPEVQESLRYLDLIATLTDDVAPALNWPRVLVDEPTMIQLRRLARARGRSLADLVQEIDTIAEEVSPLTRTVITDFLTGIAADLRPFVQGPLSDLIDRLLLLLSRRRSPIPTEERETLLGFLAFLTRALSPALATLTVAVTTGRQIVVRHSGDPDTTAAALILEYAFRHYLRHPIAVRHTDTLVQTGTLTIDLRSPVPGSAAPSVTLTPLETRDQSYPVAVLAWHLGQMLLMSFETLDQARFTVFDLETGSNHTNTTEIIELAALRVASGTTTTATFSSLICPNGPGAITHDAEQIHGIGWRDVEHAPTAAEVLPRFLDFLGADALVGHNIDNFDGRILRRVCQALGLPAPHEETIDTAKLARRLLPNQSHSLESLAHEYGIITPGESQPHRALPDCALVAAVFSRLLERSRAERELDTLDETLPLIALAIAHSSDDPRDELATLALAGARGLSVGQGAALVDRWLDLQSDLEPARASLARLQAIDTVGPTGDAHWTEFANRWRETIATYLSTGNEPTLSAFLHYARLATSIDESASSPGRVTLMTIHAAKGREWPLVFVIGAEDGFLPFWGSTSDDALAEERRILYVALTRARQQARLLWAASSQGRTRQRSRFLDAIPPHLIRSNSAPPPIDRHPVP